MYAAAGGASIANRRKQKRLQLSKKDGASNLVAARARSLSAYTAVGQQFGHHPYHHQTQHGKLSVGQQQPHHIVPTLQLSLPAQQAPTTTYGFHSSHDHSRSIRGTRRGGRINERKFSSTNNPRNRNNLNRENKYHFHSSNVSDNRHRLLAPPPISPTVQFPISPPPLSLESTNSLVVNNNNDGQSNNNNLENARFARKNDGFTSSSGGAVAFPFPPPSFLDLRVSPTSELQCGGQGPGKAAWQGCARPSPLPLSPASPQGSRGEGYKTKQCEAHRRWMKRNRIRDASYCYGSSGEDNDDYEDYDDRPPDSATKYDGFGPTTRRRRVVEVNAAANTILYAGLGITALGLIISFVGTGEKGFLSPELKLVGPSLLCAGLLCCLVRVLLCLCMCRCCGDCRWRSCCKFVAPGKSSTSSSKAKTSPGPTGDQPKSKNSNVKSETLLPDSRKNVSASGSGSNYCESRPSAMKKSSVNPTPNPHHHHHHHRQEPKPPTIVEADHNPSASTSAQRQNLTPVPSSSASTSSTSSLTSSSTSSLSTSTCSTAKSHKAHELLLSPAQLSE